MSRKRAAFIAAIAAGALGAAVALPAGAYHPSDPTGPHSGGYAQTAAAALKLGDLTVGPVVVDTGLGSLEVCLPVVGCKRQELKASAGGTINSNSAIQLALNYVLLQNTTHLPDVTTAAGTVGHICQEGPKAGQSVPGVSLVVANGESNRFTRATASLKINGNEQLNADGNPAGPGRTIVSDSDTSQTGLIGTMAIKFGLGC